MLHELASEFHLNSQYQKSIILLTPKKDRYVKIIKSIIDSIEWGTENQSTQNPFLVYILLKRMYVMYNNFKQKNSTLLTN